MRKSRFISSVAFTLALLGAGGLWVSGKKSDAASRVSKGLVSENSLLASAGESCAIFERGYSSRLESEEDDVFVVGCGGVF